MLEAEFKEGGGAAKLKQLGIGSDSNNLVSAIVAEAGDAIPREPEKSKLMGHRARVTKVAFHPMYTQLASSSEDASIKIWDYETGEVEQTLREHTGMVNYIAFNPSGDHLASCARDMTIKLWKRNKEQEYRCQRTLQGHEHVEVEAFEQA